MFLFMLAHQFALSLFRTIAAITRSLVLAYPVAWLMFLTILLLGAFILNKRNHPALSFHERAVSHACAHWNGWDKLRLASQLDHVNSVSLICLLAAVAICITMHIRR